MTGATWELVGLSLQINVRCHLETSREKMQQGLYRRVGTEAMIVSVNQFNILIQELEMVWRNIGFSDWSWYSFALT